MQRNLRARLARIRKTVDHDKESTPCNSSAADNHTVTHIAPPAAPPAVLSPQKRNTFSEWEEAGFKVLRRTVTLPFALPAVLPETLPWLVADLAREQESAGEPPERFLFFDLETTGLSGGAGTVAFLAAFGRFTRDTPDDGTGKIAQRVKQKTTHTSLSVTQFLLLDYPGEPDFLEQVLSFIAEGAPETAGDSGSGTPYFLTTYNGKAFDTQILKTRCLMNGLALPPFFQVDLLHPARRLWKRMLPNCSQATVETMVLGLDRTGDTPGAMAPDIWFNFLRSGGEFAVPETAVSRRERESPQGQLSESGRALLGICDHNVKDIFGLATMFRSFAEIAASPLEGTARFHCDEENLALVWRKNSVVPRNNTAAGSGNEQAAALLLQSAAKNYPRSCLRLAFDQIRRGRYDEGRAALKVLADSGAVWKVPCGTTVRALSLRSLAVDAERRLGQRSLALSYIEKALEINNEAGAAGAAKLPRGLRDDLEKRLNRLR